MKKPLYEVSETTKKKRIVAVHNTYESYVAAGRKPRKIIAFWPEYPFDEAFEDAMNDPGFTEEDKKQLSKLWHFMVESERKRNTEPLFGIIVTLMEDSSDPIRCIPIPAVAEDMIELPGQLPERKRD